VPNDGAKARAEQLARSVEGVQKVANHLQVTNEGEIPTP
ncbi:MAG: BON domain-containing protein, partial [Candidatus Xenobia bacterium]